MATGTLNTNTLDATGVELSLTTETVVTVTVLAKTGTSLNHCVILQQSPDSGITWQDVPPPIVGEGSLTMQIVATRVRAKVKKIEGATSTVDVHILAR
jgi:hypothetical protein